MKKTFKWWHAVIIFIVANALSAAPAGYNGEEAFYNSFKQPAVAPPDWAFAQIWLILNITSLYALYLVANLPRGTPNPKAFIISESIGWVLFSVFAIFYFGMKSPVLGAINTVMGLVVASVSLYCSFTLNKMAMWNILPRVLWLMVATYVSVYIAVENRDEFLSFLS